MALGGSDTEHVLDMCGNPGRMGDEEITVFESVGLAAEGMAVAAAYEGALASGVGREI